MFVLTVDQIASSSHPDLVDERIAAVTAAHGDAVRLGPDRTAGDEFQLVVLEGPAALAIVLDLLRDGGWSVGLGVGAAETPLPATAREARGPAFVAARDAVERAKRSPTRFALTAAADRAGDVEALIDLLLTVRARRSAEGWEVADLLEDGRTQADAAAALGVTPQAVSLRARAAAVSVDRRAVPAVARLLAELDGDRPGRMA